MSTSATRIRAGAAIMAAIAVWRSHVLPRGRPHPHAARYRAEWRFPS
jgi:hypothetical protein